MRNELLIGLRSKPGRASSAVPGIGDHFQHSGVFDIQYLNVIREKFTIHINSKLEQSEAVQSSLTVEVGFQSHVDLERVCFKFVVHQIKIWLPAPPALANFFRQQLKTQLGKVGKHSSYKQSWNGVKPGLKVPGLIVRLVVLMTSTKPKPTRFFHQTQRFKNVGVCYSVCQVE